MLEAIIIACRAGHECMVRVGGPHESGTRKGVTSVQPQPGSTQERVRPGGGSHTRGAGESAGAGGPSSAVLAAAGALPRLELRLLERRGGGGAARMATTSSGSTLFGTMASSRHRGQCTTRLWSGMRRRLCLQAPGHSARCWQHGSATGAQSVAASKSPPLPGWRQVREGAHGLSQRFAARRRTTRCPPPPPPPPPPHTHT